MSDYDKIKASMQELYDAAIAKLAELDREREEVLKNIELLGNICEKKTYTLENLKDPMHASVKKGVRISKKRVVADVAVPKKSCEGKKPRIKEEVVRDLVLKCLEDVYPNTLAASEILEKLENAGLPHTKSFTTRVYGKLREWVKAGMIIKSSRGVYQLAKKD